MSYIDLGDIRRFFRDFIDSEKEARRRYLAVMYVVVKYVEAFKTIANKDALMRSVYSPEAFAKTVGIDKRLGDLLNVSLSWYWGVAHKACRTFSEKDLGEIKGEITETFKWNDDDYKSMNLSEDDDVCSRFAAALLEIGEADTVLDCTRIRSPFLKEAGKTAVNLAGMYDDAKNEQAILEARIAEIEQTLKNAKVVDSSTLSSEHVHIGSTVKVLRVDNKKCPRFPHEHFL